MYPENGVGLFTEVASVFRLITDYVGVEHENVFFGHRHSISYGNSTKTKNVAV